MQTTSPHINRRSSPSASWRRMRQAQGHSPMPSRRPHVSAPTRPLATLSAVLAPVALASLFFLAGSLSSAPHAQTHAATLSPSSSSAVDLAALTDMRAQHSATVRLRYQRGYSVQGSWLCYGWANGAYHCTQHWYRASSGAYVSRNPSWVPSQAASGSSVTVTTFAAAMSSKPGNSYPYGQCTWAAMALAQDNVNGLGNAKEWLGNARARGLPTGSTPRVGATVVYQPGVQGASGLGHVAHVISVSGNTFVVKEMNYYGYGGGWGRWSYRTSWVQAGVSFIY